MSIQTNPRVNKFQRVLSMKGWNERNSQNISLLSGPKFTTLAFLKKEKNSSGQTNIKDLKCTVCT